MVGLFDVILSNSSYPDAARNDSISIIVSYSFFKYLGVLVMEITPAAKYLKGIVEC